MNILNKITIKNLKLNKKRAIGTIIGIILSIALICAVGGMVTSFQRTLVENAINETGYYHLKLNINDAKKLENLKYNRDIKDIKKVYVLGYSYFDYIDKDDYPYIKILSATKANIENLAYTLVEGRLPDNQNEIVISEQVSKESNYKIGDTLKLNIGTRMSLDGYELNDHNPYLGEEKLTNLQVKTKKIVGIVSKRDFNNIYYAITTSEESAKINAYISLKNPRNYQEDIDELLEDKQNDDYELNDELLRWEVLAFSDSTIKALNVIAGVVIFIIVITSVFCIRNSFAISITEKMKMYGMLSSVGATKKQIKKSVIHEGFILGIIGIPLGILSGIFAVFVLIKIINALMGDFILSGSSIVFYISIIPIVISICLGFIVIYLSAITSARRASKVSPIENLRNTKDIKISSKKLKTPKIISVIFKTGGELAYKNLKRSKKKYLTTVISLTVSIFTFISMSTFISEGFRQTSFYYKDFDYNVAISGGISEMTDLEINKLKKLNDAKNTYISYSSSYSLKITDHSVINNFSEVEANLLSDDCDENNSCEKYSSLEIIALDNETFKSYVKKLKINYSEFKNKGILCDEYLNYIGDKKILNRTYKYKEKDIVSGKLTDNKTDFSVEIGLVSNIRPYGLESTYYQGGYLIVNKDYYNNLDLKPNNILFDADNPDALIKNIDKLGLDLDVYNLDEAFKAQRSMIVVVSIFLYGFITVITLIGVTNIFNTINANMELRSKEFAMLKSIGMTKKEFNRMINLETLFYSAKSLVYGIVLGILGSLAIHKSFGLKLEMTFKIPYLAILISIIFVFAIVYIIMKYSISKINKQNTIETIRNDNI